MFRIVLLCLWFPAPDAPCVGWTVDQANILTCSDGRRFDDGWYAIVDSERAIVLGYDR